MSIVINIGMWFERFVIIVTSLHRGHLPGSWTMFYPTWVDIGIFVGTLGIFFTLFLLFARYFPVLALNEIKTILKTSGENYKNSFGHGKGFWDKHSHGHSNGSSHQHVDLGLNDDNKEDSGKE